MKMALSPFCCFEPFIHFFSREIEARFGVVTPYRMARSNGNTLLYLPQEIRDEVYDLVLTKDGIRGYEDFELTRDPPAIMQACKQLYYEAEPYYIKHTKVPIWNDYKLKEKVSWLKKRESCDGPQKVGAAVISNIDMLTKDVLDKYKESKKSERLSGSGSVFRVIHFFSLCKNIKTVEFRLSVTAFFTGLFWHNQQEDHPDRVVAAIQGSYDFEALLYVEKLSSVIFYFNWDLDNSGPSRNLQMQFYTRMGRSLTARSENFGFLAWLEAELGRAGKEVDVFCLHKGDVWY